jgi:RHS repeat-associated protein
MSRLIISIGTTGKEFQEELGLNWYDFGARMYMSDIGRWGVVDPLVESTMDPYGYCYQNPVKYIDPTGMSGESTKDWVEKSNGDIYWDPNATSQATTKEGETYRGTYYARQKEWDNKYSQGDGVEVYNVKNGKPTVTHHSVNEFGLVQVTSLDSRYISNNENKEDTYSYLKTDGTRSNEGTHGDDWMKPSFAAAFVNSVESLAQEVSNLNIVFNDASGYNPINNKSYYNLGHSKSGGHSRGEAFDIRFLTVNGKGSNSIFSLSAPDIQLNARFIEILKGTGVFKKFFSDRGRIPGSSHAAAHKDHLHGQ